MITLLLLAAVGLYVLLLWAWHSHCFFLFHVWDTSRYVADVCVRCGELRFKV
jgi:hypothetical protein